MHSRVLGRLDRDASDQAGVLQPRDGEPRRIALIFSATAANGTSSSGWCFETR